MYNMKYLLGIILCLSISSCSMKPLETVQHVDIEKYMGRWYEIAAFPQRFEKGCSCTIAEYSLKENGTVRVRNSCRKGDGNKVSVGKAKITDKGTNAKLKVTFFWPFWGKYWIVDLADDYSYTVVGHPNRKYLWILSRKPKMDEGLYQEILSRIDKMGYDTTKIKRTRQDCW